MRCKTARKPVRLSSVQGGPAGAQSHRAVEGEGCAGRGLCVCVGGSCGREVTWDTWRGRRSNLYFKKIALAVRWFVASYVVKSKAAEYS